jgi:hypothetical protein
MGRTGGTYESLDLSPGAALRPWLRVLAAACGLWATEGFAGNQSADSGYSLAQGVFGPSVGNGGKVGNGQK